MNIIVSLFGSNGTDYCFRPDTTLEKESFDYYIPDGVSELTYSPVLFVRLCRAGKAIGEKFAGRYYDSGGFGVLLYGESIIGSGAAAGLSMASSLDKTSLLPFPLIDKDVLEKSGNIFSLSVNFCAFPQYARKFYRTVTIQTAYRGRNTSRAHCLPGAAP